MSNNLISSNKFENKPLPSYANEDILVSGSQLMLLMLKNDNTKAVYDNFNSNYLQPFIDSKLPTDLKSIINNIYKRDIIYIGVHPKSNSNVLGHYVTNHDSLAAIILNSSMIDIDIVTGECNEPDTATLVTYQQFIRYIVDTNIDKIKSNDELHSLLISYYISLLKKYLELDSLNDKQSELLSILVTVVYYKHFLMLDHKLACSKIATFANYPDLKSVLSDPSLIKTNNIAQITNLIVDYHLISQLQSPNALVFKLLSKLKIIPYLSIISNLSYLISSIVVANQNLIHFQSLKISPNLQSNIEKMIVPFINNVKYDSTVVKKIKSL